MQTQQKRLYFIDWLRLLAFGLLILFHAWRPFDHYGWHIKNDLQSAFFDFLTFFIHGWRMDLIFLVSGVGTWFALQSRNSLFISDRVKRLLIPFIFGILVIIPPQKFIEGITFHNYQGNFIDFLVDWPAIAFSSNFGASILLWFGHLGAHIYYLPFLFVMTLPVVMVYRVFRKVDLRMEGLRKIILTPWGLFLLMIPMLVSRFALKPLFPHYTDWADFFTYLWMFIYGFVFVKESSFITTVKDRMWLFLNLGILSSLLLLYFMSQGNENMQAAAMPQYDLIHLYVSFLSVMISFNWVMFFVALSAKRLNFNHSFLKPANSAILPVYILHQTIIVVLGYFIIRWQLSIYLKFILIALVTVITSVGLYLFIKKINVFRFVFGMKL